MVPPWPLAPTNSSAPLYGRECAFRYRLRKRFSREARAKVQRRAEKFSLTDRNRKCGRHCFAQDRMIGASVQALLPHRMQTCLPAAARFRCIGPCIRFKHHFRENRNDHIGGEVWFDSIPFSKAVCEICLAMASDARRPRAAAGPARIPDARRSEGVSGICSPERRQPGRLRAATDAAAVTAEAA